MIITKNKLVIFLAIPITALALLVFYKKYLLTAGEDTELSISAYDPRDLLSGHYLSFQVDYGVNGICDVRNPSQVAYICLSTKSFSYSKPEYCQKLIQGICNYGRLVAGIEKYYIPEDKAKFLEEKIRNKKASIIISTNPTGQAQIKQLLIDGIPWTELK